MISMKELNEERRFLNEEALPALMQFIRIPSKSRFCDPDWERNGQLVRALREGAQWGEKLFPEGVFEILTLPGKTPALFFDIPAENHDGRPAFFYGHFDKQPEAEGWSEGLAPFTPVVRDGKLYGRGGADDGYSFYTALSAVRILLDRTGRSPRITGLIETDEESGSRDLPDYLQAVAPRIGSPAVLSILDLGVRTWDRLWTTRSLRGVAQVTVKVSVLRHGVHSGSASGTVPSSFRILRRLLDRIENAETGDILLPECHGVIPEDVRQELEGETKPADFPWVGHTRPMAETPAKQLLASTWKPALSVVAQEGIPPLSAGSAQLRPYTTLMLSMRLAPTADAKMALDAMVRTLTTDVPYDAEVEILHASYSPGFYAGETPEWLERVWSAAGERFFGQKPGVFFEGGTIGILEHFREAFPDSAFLMTGMLGPDSNAHGPDESLDLAYWEKLTLALSEVLAALPEENERKEVP